MSGGSILDAGVRAVRVGGVGDECRQRGVLLRVTNEYDGHNGGGGSVWE